jgi:hypothetical protein
LMMIRAEITIRLFDRAWLRAYVRGGGRLGMREEDARRVLTVLDASRREIVSSKHMHAHRIRWLAGWQAGHTYRVINLHDVI